jgi:hypothetical protein
MKKDKKSALQEQRDVAIDMMKVVMKRLEQEEGFKEMRKAFIDLVKNSLKKNGFEITADNVAIVGMTMNLIRLAKEKAEMIGMDGSDIEDRSPTLESILAIESERIRKLEGRKKKTKKAVKKKRK